MGAPLASKPELSECCECTQICSTSPLAAGGFCPQRKYRAMAADTTTAAARPAQTTWLEPLVNSSPRAASSSLVESCRRRLIGLYLMPEGAQPNIDFVFTVGRIRILSCSKLVTSGAIRPTPKQPTEDSFAGQTVQGRGRSAASNCSAPSVFNTSSGSSHARRNCRN